MAAVPNTDIITPDHHIFQCGSLPDDTTLPDDRISDDRSRADFDVFLYDRIIPNLYRRREMGVGPVDIDVEILVGELGRSGRELGS